MGRYWCRIRKVKNMKNGEIDKYLKEKIKDKKGIAAVKELIKKGGLVSLDIEDIKSVVDSSKSIHTFSGDENDFVKKVKEPHEIKSVAISFEAPEGTSLKEIMPAIERITEKMDKEVHIIWGAKISEKAEKITFVTVLGY